MKLDKIKKQIKELNDTVFCKIAPSKTHGVGVLAIRDIPRGTKMGCAPKPLQKFYKIPFDRFNEILPEVRELIISYWGSVVNDTNFLSPNDIVILTSYMNHSDNPNYDYFMDFAIKDIKRGEEVFENYRTMMPNAKIAFPFL